MEKKEINSLVIEFNKLANLARNELGVIEDVLSAGKVPSIEIVNSFNQKIKSLHEEYSNIYSFAENILSEYEMIPMGEAVSKYVQAIEDKRSRVIEEQFENVNNILSKFLTVRSSVEAYSEALQPFQDDARDILNQLNSLKSTGISEISGKLNAPEVFIRILDIKDLDSDEGIELLEKASMIYPVRIQNGLARKTYFYEKSEITTIHRVTEVMGTTDSIARQRKSTVLDIKKRESEILNVTEKPKGQIETAIADNKKLDDIIVKNTTLLQAVNKIKTSTPSASSFKKEIIKLPKEIRTILPLCTNMGILTEEQIHKFGVCMDCFYDNDEGKDKVNSALEILVNKGLIAKYLIGEQGIVAYCLTNYTYSCMMKETISTQMKGFWTLTYGQFKVCGKEKIEQDMVIDIISKNMSLLTYFYGIKRFLSEDEYYRIKASIKRNEKSCEVLVIYNEENVYCKIVSDNHELSLTNYDNILFIMNGKEYPRAVGEQCKSLYIYLNEDIIKCQLPLTDEDSARRQLGSIIKNKNNSVLEEIVVESDDDKGIQVGSFDIKQKSINSEIMKDLCNEYKDEPQSLIDIIDETAEEDEEIPTDEEFCEIINEILDMPGKKDINNTSSVIRALLLSKTASLIKSNIKCKELYNKSILLCTPFFIFLQSSTLYKTYYLKINAHLTCINHWKILVLIYFFKKNVHLINISS